MFDGTQPNNAKARFYDPMTQIKRYGISSEIMSANNFSSTELISLISIAADYSAYISNSIFSHSTHSTLPKARAAPNVADSAGPTYRRRRRRTATRPAAAPACAR